MGQSMYVFLKFAVTYMIWNNRTDILCPCDRYKNLVALDPFSGSLRTRLLRNGLYCCLSCLIMIFPNLRKYHAWCIAKILCMSLVDGVVCSVQGRVPWVYSSWSRCQGQVNEYTHNSYKRFNSRYEAKEDYLQFLMQVPKIVVPDQGSSSWTIGCTLHRV
jgi:hypothetical protein